MQAAALFFPLDGRHVFECSRHLFRATSNRWKFFFKRSLTFRSSLCLCGLGARVFESKRVFFIEERTLRLANDDDLRRKRALNKGLLQFFERRLMDGKDAFTFATNHRTFTAGITSIRRCLTSRLAIESASSIPLLNAESLLLLLPDTFIGNRLFVIQFIVGKNRIGCYDFNVFLTFKIWCQRLASRVEHHKSLAMGSREMSRCRNSFIHNVVCFETRHVS